MAYLDISSKSASILLNTDGADDPDQLVAVAAGELFEWAWLIGELAAWLQDADEHTRADFARCLRRLPHARQDRVVRHPHRRAYRRATRRGSGPAMSTATTPTPSAPPLDAELERLLKRMRLPYIRRAAPELLATAKRNVGTPARCSKRF